MSQLQPFFFDGREVRVVRDEQGEPWFVAKDVCDILGIGNSRDAVSRLDDDEKGSVGITDGTSPQGGNPNMSTVSESGLYALIFTSRKPEARAFRKWVTGTVLPAIRKTGRFEAPRFGMDNMPKSIRMIRPYVRAQILAGAVQAAKLGNHGCDNIYFHFQKMAELISGNLPMPEVGRPAEKQKHDTAFYADLFEKWADDCLEPADYGRVQAKYLYASFCDWCRDVQGMAPPSMHQLGFWLSRHFRRKESNVTYYGGIRLRKRGKQAA